jgi:hypothetical protein
MTRRAAFGLRGEKDVANAFDGMSPNSVARHRQ